MNASSHQAPGASPLTARGSGAGPALLLTGFEPFGGAASNPSWSVAERLDGLEVNGLRVVARRLPVDGRRAPEALEDALESLRPAAVLMLGLAAGRPQVSVERVAVNVLDYPIADNAGVRRAGEPVVPGGPDAYLSSLPLASIVAAWRAAGLPGFVSESAGTYLCNQVFYLTRHQLSRSGRAAAPAGFLHLPCDEALALTALRPYVPLAHQLRSVRAALETTALSVP